MKSQPDVHAVCHVMEDSASDSSESASVRPDSESVRPDSESVGPDSASVRPDSASVRPDSESVRPDSAPVRREQRQSGQSSVGHILRLKFRQLSDYWHQGHPTFSCFSLY